MKTNYETRLIAAVLEGLNTDTAKPAPKEADLAEALNIIAEQRELIAGMQKHIETLEAELNQAKRRR